MHYADNCCVLEEVFNPQRYIYTGPCVMCKEGHSVSVPGPELFQFRRGAHIQDAMPSVEAGDREFLMTGICPKCFDEMFADDEEDLPFKIMGKYREETEEVDEFETREEADSMLDEYRLAFGEGWRLWIKKEKK